MRRAGLRALVVFGSLALLFAALEAGLRLRQALATGSRVGWAVYDPDLGYRPRPGYRDHNAFGFRGGPVGPKKSFRVLLLGDSVTYYGDSPADTYPGRLARLLASDPDLAPVEVLNAGVRGYTNYQEVLFLEKIGLELSPDLVGIGFVLNDLHRILHRFVVRDGRIVGESYSFAEEALRSVQSPVYQIARRSLLLVWLRRRFAAAGDALVALLGEAYSFELRPDFATAWRDAPWDAVESQLGRFQELARTHGFRTFLVVFPFGDQYRDDYLERDRGYVLEPQRRLAAICRRLGIPFLDLYPLLSPTDLLPDRIHLTPAGRAHTAAALADFLRRENLLPSRHDAGRTSGEPSTAGPPTPSEPVRAPRP